MSTKINLTGTCEDMCPASERTFRERLRDLSPFEVVPGSNPVKSNKHLAVKKFCRTLSAMTLKPSDIRSVSALKRTVCYLVDLLDSTNHSLESVYDFVADRFRAVRQEVILQRIVGKDAIEIYKPIVKFYIVFGYKLGQIQDKSLHFDPFLNREQLFTSLLTLLNFFNGEAKLGKHLENEEGEFFSFFVLLNLSGDSRFLSDSLSYWFQKLRPSVLETKEMKFAFLIFRKFKLGYYWQVCELMKEANELQACLLDSVLKRVRMNALNAINSSFYKRQPFPLEDIKDSLLFQDLDEVVNFCKECSLPTVEVELYGICLLVKEKSLKKPQKNFVNKVWIEKLRPKITNKEIVLGRM